MNEEYTKNGRELNNLPLENNPAKEFMYFVFDLLKTGIVVFVIAFCIRYFMIQPFVVEGGSMMPNFVDREYLLAEKLSFELGTPKRGDVVIFKYPKNPSINYIKRIIALPGDTISIADNKVTIKNDQNSKGIVLAEQYLPGDIQTLTNGKEKLEIKVDSDSYFVMGDNREHSSDSREWGLLPKSNLIGRAWLTIRPVSKFGFQDKVSYSGLVSLTNHIIKNLAYLN